eukprot:Pgem_evm1s13455
MINIKRDDTLYTTTLSEKVTKKKDNSVCTYVDCRKEKNINFEICVPSFTLFPENAIYYKIYIQICSFQWYCFKRYVFVPLAI